ncbi:hypothetical protein J4573_43135 [Actinomadura barringtoniae]|uniref:Methylamine utilisation protein MauE domain-containing protein n=1 Tax=Actinomadura barringtoniae TaxID=1427535 RepID=A0A939PSG5_9ACTN|nr:MauE/DoxX family redox-associated membrane protein [Actinomadura barringtoniae]MBO2453946.1 hypothetical protein [Actinomadura barringtoniae]
MTGLLAGIAMIAVPLVLLGALAGHLRRPGVLPAALRAHRTVPRSLVVPVAVAAVAAEALLGLVAAAGVVLWQAGLVRGALAGAAVLLAIYALYGAYVRPRGVPCGCAGDLNAPMTGWVAGRAAVLAALSVAGAVWGLPDDTDALPLAVTVIAGAVFAVILWTLPQAMIETKVAR